jgi:arylsulfatase A-like enzyme
MNVILIITDTMRRDHLGLYGCERVHTPNLDRLAQQSCVFENAYAASFPTVPNRMDIMTGRFTFTEAGWQPLPREATVVSEVLGAGGYTTMLVADTPHILANAYGYDRGFAGWEWIRGQENDRWRTAPADPELPAAPEKLRNPAVVKQHLRNTWHRKGEEDTFVARTMRAAGDWLAENADRDFFLYVDTFDPHEPWDAPQEYVDRYDPGYEGDRVSYPIYGQADYLSERELQHLRALYAAEVTLVDAQVGRLLDRVESLGLADDTAIIYTTDHGFFHGEHGWTGKSFIGEGGYRDMPLYSEVARIPLMIRHAGRSARGAAEVLRAAARHHADDPRSDGRGDARDGAGHLAGAGDERRSRPHEAAGDQHPVACAGAQRRAADDDRGGRLGAGVLRRARRAADGQPDAERGRYPAAGDRRARARAGSGALRPHARSGAEVQRV